MATPPLPDWLAELPAAGEAYPDDLVRLVWRYFRWDAEHARDEWAHPRSEGELRALVNLAFQASLRSEEERPVRFQVVFDLEPRQVTFDFERPLDYTVGQLVKLSPTIGIGNRWLVVTPGAGADEPLRIAGVCDPILSPHPTAAGLLTRWVEGMGVHVPEVTGVALSVLGPGWLRISTWAQKYFELRDCSIRLPFTLHEIAAVKSWYEEVCERLGIPERAIGRALLRRMWGGIVSRVRDARHGGCFLLVPGGVAPGELPVRVLYPLRSPRLQEVVRARMAVEPALSRHVQGHPDVELAALDAAHFLDRDVVRAIDLAASLAEVDGAVVLHRDLRLLGFGAEIVNIGAPSEDERVRYGNRGPGGRLDKPLAGFGMRHRSAYRFCQQVPGAVAFVLSQDGDLRVFAREAEQVLLFEGPAPEDRVMAM